MTDASPDSDLLSAYVREECNAAFSELVQRHIGLVYRSALRQLGGDCHGAEDVTQAVFTLLARKAHRLREHPSLVGWLHTTTRHLAKDARRGAARRRAREQEALTMNSPESEPNWHELGPVIDAALGELEERDCTAVLLRYFSGLSFAAVGAKLGVAENAARMRVDRALDKLRVALRRHGIASTGTALAVALEHEAVGAAVPIGLASQVSHVALSAGGAGAAAAGGAAVLLSIGKLATLMSFVLAVATLGTVGYGLYARHGARELLASTQRQLHDADEHARVLDAEAAAKEHRLEELRAQVAKARTDAAARTAERTAAEERAAEWDPRAEGTAFMTRHPAVRKALRDWIVAGARYHYAPFLQEQHLSAEQTDRFFELISGINNLTMPFGPGGRQLMFSLDDGNHVQSVAPELRSLLGDAGMKALRQYQRTLTVRDDVTSLASSLAYSDAPMTAQQADALTSAFTAQVQTTKGKPQLDFNWPALTDQAQTILTPAQLPSFMTLKEAILTRQRQMIVTSTGNAGKKP